MAQCSHKALGIEVLAHSITMVAHILVVVHMAADTAQVVG